MNKAKTSLLISAALALALAAGAQTLKISQQPVTTNVSVYDDLLINATNAGAGTWTTKRGTVARLIDGAAAQIGGIVATQAIQGSNLVNSTVGTNKLDSNAYGLLMTGAGSGVTPGASMSNVFLKDALLASRVPDATTNAPGTTNWTGARGSLSVTNLGLFKDGDGIYRSPNDLGVIVSNGVGNSRLIFTGPMGYDGGLWWWANHADQHDYDTNYWQDYANYRGPELGLYSFGKLCLDPAYSIQVGVAHRIREGGGGMYLQNSTSGTYAPGSYSGFDTNSSFTAPFTGRPQYWNGSAWVNADQGDADTFPGFSFLARREVDGTHSGNSMLVFWDKYHFHPGQYGFSYNWAKMQPRMKVLFSGGSGGGLELRGKLVLENTAQTQESSSVWLDFNKGQCVTLTLTGDATLATTNRTGASTNYEQRVFLLRSDIVDCNLTWPSGWNWLSGGCATNTLPGGQIMRLRLESVGPGESNILACAQVATNTSLLAMDADAQDYIDRANVTSSSAQLAFNAFVHGLKDAGIWEKLYALWPLYGSSTNYTSQNLVSTNFDLIWTNALTDPALHSVAGVSNTGAADSCALTAFNPSEQSIVASNFHMMVWCVSTNGTGSGVYSGDAGCAIGTVVSGNYSAIYVGSNSVAVQGPWAPGSSNQHGTTNVSALANGTRGFIYAGTSVPPYPNCYFGTQAMIYGGGAPGSTVLTNSIALFANISSTPLDESAIMLAGASIGEALSDGERETYQQLWTQLQGYLGRQ